MGKDTLELSVNAMLIIGFAAFSLGTLVWIVRVLVRSDVPPEFYFVVIGSMMIVLSLLTSRILSRL